jgi:hypothetical protein
MMSNCWKRDGRRKDSVVSAGEIKTTHIKYNERQACLSQISVDSQQNSTLHPLTHSLLLFASTQPNPTVSREAQLRQQRRREREGGRKRELP